MATFKELIAQLEKLKKTVKNKTKNKQYRALFSRVYRLRRLAKFRKYERTYRSKNAERINGRLRQWNKERRKADPAAARERDRLHRERYGEQHNAWRRENYAADPDKQRSYKKQYRADHPKNKETEKRYNDEYYASHKKQIADKARNRYLADPDRYRAYSRAYGRENSEKQKAAAKKWRDNNKAKIAEEYRRWRKANPEKTVVIRNRRRAKLMGATIRDLTAEQWQAIKWAYDNCCAYCKKPCDKLTQDHIIPISKGGNHTASNIAPACRSCNSKKGNRPI